MEIFVTTAMFVQKIPTRWGTSRRSRRSDDIFPVRLSTPAGIDGRCDAPRRVCAFVRSRRGREVKKEYKEEKDPPATRTRGSRVVRQKVNEARVIGCRSIDS
ncbi:uncharacterized protein [Mycetomoellerius zeteki]|uniref:uncharacterized protein n=1 Tax=Mycetomoellerius zeteki TaxID=64791 RepID=UPI00084E8FAA|nr:PREDICTED: uncharacterized protein LOC108731780 [Trachymyrmex zeteki]